MYQGKNLYLLCILFGINVYVSSIFAQEVSDTIHYNLMVDDEVIGDLMAVKRMNDDSTVHYVVLSNVDYRLIFSFHITFLYESMFSPNGKYTSSQFVYTFNEDVRESNWIHYIGDKWYVYEGNEVKDIIDNPIHQTAVQLYFLEPSEELLVFSERYCDFYTVEKMDDDGYEIEFPGGTNTYYYKDGLCYRITISTLLSDMEFIQKVY